MFETGPIHALQSLASTPLTAVMWTVTLLGYFPAYMLALAVIMFGVDIRKGVLLSQFVLVTLALTDLLKGLIALPRPVDVDASIRHLDSGKPNEAPFTGAGAPTFFAMPAAAAIEYYRGLSGYSYGFPSGHVSTATAFWGGAAILFRRRWLPAAALCAIVLMALSRMYLGRHFLGDVIGGALLGTAVLAAGVWRFGAGRGPVTLPRSSRFPLSPAALLGLVGVPVVLLLLPGAELDAARLLGFNLGYIVLMVGGWVPNDEAPPARRAVRVLLGLGLAVLALRFTPGALPLAGVEPDPLRALVAGGLPPFVMMAGTVLIGRRLRLYSAP